jgi:hypothetical protein
MQELLDSSCGGLTIVSDFFQWNPESETPINYVTQAQNKYLNLILFQKSDVKRPNDSNNATKAETNFMDLLENICKTFNLGYKVTGNNFRLEHISFFESDLGINLLSNPLNKKYLNGTRKYGYDENKLPKYEKFSFMESGSADFVGVDIRYSSNCVNNDEENRSNNDVENITTDVLYCLENPASDSDVGDDGFVIIACDGSNNVLFDDGILEANTSLNNVLSWAHLHRDLWKYGRVLFEGNMNGVDTEFESIVPTIKQNRFETIMSCDAIKAFDPLDQIKATLGWGFVQSAELTLSQCRMGLEISLKELDLGTSYEQIFGDFDEDFSEEFD